MRTSCCSVAISSEVVSTMGSSPSLEPRSGDRRQDIVSSGDALEMRILQATVIVNLRDAEVAAVVDDEFHRRPCVLRIGDRATEQIDGEAAAVHGNDLHAV